MNIVLNCEHRVELNCEHRVEYIFLHAVLSCLKGSHLFPTFSVSLATLNGI